MIAKMSNLDAYVSLAMALVAGFTLVVGRRGALDNLLTFNDRAGWGHAVSAEWSKPKEYFVTNGTHLE